MKTVTPAQSNIEKWNEVSPDDFEEELNDSWEAITALKKQVTQLVQQQRITPLQAIGVLACTTGQIFNYPAFHNQPSMVDLYTLFTDGKSSR